METRLGVGTILVIQDDARVFWLKIVIVAGLAIGILLSKKLWAFSRFYPHAPILKNLPKPHNDRILLILLLSLLGSIALIEKPGIFIFALVALLGVLVVYDQARWQAWVYQYVFMLAAVGVYSWNKTNSVMDEAILNTCRLIIISIYFWSGLQKLNATFIKDIFPWLIEPFSRFIPRKIHVSAFATIAPFIECDAMVHARTQCPSLSGG